MKKTVLKVNINGSKCKAKLLKIVTELEGIDKVEVDATKGTLTVVGVVDPVVVANKLRKSGKMAEIISVGPPKKEDGESEKPKLNIPLPYCKQCELVAIGFQYDGRHDQTCSIL